MKTEEDQNVFNYYRITVPLASILSFLFSIIVITPYFGQISYFGNFIFSIIFLVANLIWAKKVYQEESTSEQFQSKLMNPLTIWTIIAYVINAFGLIINSKGFVYYLFFNVILVYFLNLNLSTKRYHKNHFQKYLLNGIYSYVVFSIYPLFHLVERSNFLKKYKLETNTNRFTKLIGSLSFFIFFGIPLIVIVWSLLSYTNAEFGNYLRRIISISLSPGLWFSRIVIGFIIFYIFVGFFSIYKLRKDTFEVEKRIKNNINSFFERFRFQVLSSVGLTVFILNLSYISFIFIDLSTDLRLGGESLADIGYDSYSTLAVNRFNELIVVGIINLLILFFVTNFIKKYYQLKRLSFSNFFNISSSVLMEKLSFLFINSNMLLIFISTLTLTLSVFRRVLAYAQVYGLTEKRFLVLSFVPFFILISFLIYFRLFVRKGYVLINLSIIILIMFTVSYVALPTHLIVNRLNISLTFGGNIKVYDPLYTVPVNSSTMSELIAQRGVKIIDFKNIANDNNELIDLCNTPVSELELLNPNEELPILFQKRFPNSSWPNNKECEIGLDNDGYSNDVQTIDSILLVPYILENKEELEITEEQVFILESQLDKYKEDIENNKELNDYRNFNLIYYLIENLD